MNLHELVLLLIVFKSITLSISGEIPLEAGLVLILNWGSNCNA